MYEYQAKVIDVLDGDTIAVTIDLGFKLTYATPVRFFGINAPEIHTKDHHEKEMGLKAKAKLTELLSGKVITLRTVKPNDKFGRYLAEVFLSGGGLQEKSVNQQMVDLGLCKPWDGKGEKPI